MTKSVDGLGGVLLVDCVDMANIEPTLFTITATIPLLKESTDLVQI
jgi:hypothetical protein